MASVDGDISLENPFNIPKDKKPPSTSGRSLGPKSPTVAANSGVLKLYCWINRADNVPFLKGNWFDDALVFNAATIAGYPPAVRDLFEAVPGTEGIFLKREYNYKHNFIKGKKASGEDDPLDPGRSALIAGDPIYKSEQTWLIRTDIFGHKVRLPSEYNTGFNLSAPVTDQQSIDAFNCDPVSVWTYDIVNKQTSSENGSQSNILMPRQISSSNCGKSGVHWGLQKETSLFQGEDFFIEFHRRSRSTDIPTALPGQAETIKNLKSIAEYAMLDSRSTSQVSLKYGNETVSTLANGGVATLDASKRVVNVERYDLRDQAYYIVEVGKGHPEQNYAFIITQRGYVRCVRISNGEQKYSEVISEFNDSKISANEGSSTVVVTGAQLIDSEFFRMTVRNHLGRIIVEFEGPGFKSSPWVIERSNFKIVREGRERERRPEKTYIVRGPVCLFGGNIQSGFIFSPLQYQVPNSGGAGGEVELIVPPQPNPFTSCSSIPGPKESQENGGQFLNLPLSSVHSVLLTSTDLPVQDLVKTGYSSAGSKASNKSRKADDSIMTQDAQVYSHMVEGNIKSDIDGSFFRGPPIKERSTNSAYRSKISVEKICGRPDLSNRTEQFLLKVKLRAGSHEFNSGTSPWTLHRCKTPIFTMVRLVATPDGEPRWEPKGFECSENVISFGDAWVAQDFTKIEHTGNIRFLLQDGIPWAENDHSKDILSLKNKAFYIEVWAGYIQPSPPPGNSGTVSLSARSGSACNYSKLPRHYKMFTGICYGGTVVYENNKRIMECQIFDYIKPLQDMMFFNSPFFDGVKDSFAVDEILRLAGFRGDKPNHPRALLSILTSNPSKDFYTLVGPDGRSVISRNYALPTAYDKIQQPAFKFRNGDKLFDGITKIAERAGKVFFFDSYGVAHYENYFDLVVDEITSGRASREVGCNSTITNPIFIYTTSHQSWPGQQVFNTVSIMEDVNSVYNHRKILSNTAPTDAEPGTSAIIADDVDYASIEDPNTEGFIGYMKTLYQQEGAFGSLASVATIQRFYKAMGRPPFVVKFETFGQPVRALDIVSLNGQRLRVMRVESTVDAATNKWWQTFECEWLKPIQVDPLPSVPKAGVPQNC